MITTLVEVEESVGRTGMDVRVISIVTEGGIVVLVSVEEPDPSGGLKRVNPMMLTSMIKVGKIKTSWLLIQRRTRLERRAITLRCTRDFPGPPRNSSQRW